MEKRSYLNIYLEGKRYREYNGHRIGVDIQPNKAHSIAERDYLLELLKEHYVNAIEVGEYEVIVRVSKAPDIAPVSKKQMLGRVEFTMNRALEMKGMENRAEKYYRNLKRVNEQFIEFLTTKEREGSFDNLPKERVVEFLAQFNSSATYYMNKRRHLLVLFSLAEDLMGKSIKCSYKLPRTSGKAKNHEPYTLPQLRTVLNYLRPRNHKLYMCCLLMYSCWLRPHREIRNLRVNHFKEDFTKIRLSAKENKSGRPRTVLVPAYTGDEVRKAVADMSPTDNIFSGNANPFNEDYFGKCWERLKKKMLLNKIIQPGQTLYSFRHTAAIGHYRKHRDVVLLQKILGHAEIGTTMTYLKHLGELSEDEIKMSTPDMSL